MGCCFSTPELDQNGLRNQQPQLRSHAPKSPNAIHQAECRDPPPPVEESVKEVLLETPISKPQVQILTPESKTQLPVVLHTQSPINEKAALLEEDVVSPISGTCSVGESFSTTTTVTETREDEVTSKRSNRGGTRNQNRSHKAASRRRSHAVIGNGIGGRERMQNSPARVTEPPPAKKVQMGSRRRDSGQVHRTVGAGASRSQLRPAKENGEVGGEKNGSVLIEESVDNLHVSLECFIFL